MPPPPPEPKTPMWLPAVGALAFLTVGLAWALSTPPKDPTETMATPEPVASIAQSAPVPTAPPTPPPTNVPTPVRLPASAIGAMGGMATPPPRPGMSGAPKGRPRPPPGHP